jgi:hypothetical protein
VWETILDVIQPSIAKQGFYHCDRSFRAFAREHQIPTPRQTPFYLSLDFWSQQRSELVENNLYVIRLGRGTFVIFSLDAFPRPYLTLDTENPRDITFPLTKSFRHLRTSFRNLDYRYNSAENTLLELARFYDLYAHVVNVFEPSTAYQIGPRGGMTQQFDVFMQHTNGALYRFIYNGQVELDYTVWTESRVFVFEAKSLTRRGFDIGWHKLAFPSQRFLSQVRQNELIVNPVYFLRTEDASEPVILVYVFDDLQFHENGIILNQSDHWDPVTILRINLQSLIQEIN